MDLKTDQDKLKRLFPQRGFRKGGLPMENYFPGVKSNMYLFFPDGCLHYFSMCSPTKDILPIYRQPIWPGVLRIKLDPQYTTQERCDRYCPTFMRGSIGKGRQLYPIVNLEKIKGSYMHRRITGEKEERISKSSLAFKKTLHSIVATICVPKLSPEHRYVDHINGDKCDYRIPNLRWATPRQNSIGTPGPRLDPDEIYDMSREKLSLKI